MNDTRKTALAREIADTLNDMASLDTHIRFVNKYSEDFLRRQLEYVMGKADNEIEVSRAAYYVHLVKRNGR